MGKLSDMGKLGIVDFDQCTLQEIALAMNPLRLWAIKEQVTCLKYLEKYTLKKQLCGMKPELLWMGSKTPAQEPFVESFKTTRV